MKCIECKKELSGTPYGFAGGLACETCVRCYYRNALPDHIADELRIRAREATKIIARQQHNSHDRMQSESLMNNEQ